MRLADVHRRRRSRRRCAPTCRSRSTFRPLAFPTVPDQSVIVPMFRLRASRVIYDDLRVVDLHARDRGRVLRQAAHRPRRRRRVRRRRRRDPLFTYLRTSQRHAADVDAVARRRPTSCSSASRACARRASTPLVTVSITARRPRRARRRARPAPKRCCRRAAAACRPRARAPAAADRRRPPRRVRHRRVRRARRGDRVVARVAHRRARDRRRVDARSDADDVRDDPDASWRGSPAAGMATFRWVMIPGNEPTADGRYVGITTVTDAQWLALARARSAATTWPPTTSCAR